ncbi:MAG TPA: hypothetical protein VK211_20640 [Kamptonema sp.]|nr:hypothetical protein [Kamptonema sp.]
MEELSSREQLFLEIEQLRWKMQEIQGEKKHWEIVVSEAGDRAQIALKAAIEELQSVFATLSRDKADWEPILEP